MSDDRDRILGAVRSALSLQSVRAPYPEYPDDVASLRRPDPPRPLWDWFAERCAAVHGIPLVGPAALADWLRAQNVGEGYCDPVLRDWFEPAARGLTVHYEFRRAHLDQYQFGITRAAGAMAETGTIILDDRTTSHRLAALAPWIHAAVLPPDRLYPDLATALAHLGDDPNIIFVTGPSKTADVEGILIEGVHGPGVQICCRSA